MMLYITLFVIIYGLTRVIKFAKNNPGQSMQAASWLKQMFK